MAAKRSPFGKWIYEWRKARKMTQRELAAKAGCSDSIISAYETGKRQEKGGDFIVPDPELVEALATALERPVEEARALAGYYPSPAPPTIQAVQELLAQHPGQGVMLQPGENGQYVAVLTSSQLTDLVRSVLQQVKQESENSSK